MNKIILLIVASLFLTSCASVNPYNVPEGEGAYLKNRIEYKGKSTYVYLFVDAATSAGRKGFDYTSDVADHDSIYRIPSGEIALGLTIKYFPKSRPPSTFGDFLEAMSKPFSPATWARVKPFEIFIINPKVKVSGVEGIKLDALEGHTYQINCKIEDGKAYLWIEDESGKIVSEVVRGLRAGRLGGWYWEDLPQPTH